MVIVTVSEVPSPEYLVTASGAGVSKSTKLSCLGKRISKWSHYKNRIPWECYIRSKTLVPAGYIKRMNKIWVKQGMRVPQWLTLQFRSIKSKFIQIREREEVMSYISDVLLNETPLQSYTVSIGDNPNVEVEDNEINIKTAHHEVRQEEELGVENKVAHWGHCKCWRNTYCNKKRSAWMWM